MAVMVLFTVLIVLAAIIGAAYFGRDATARRQLASTPVEAITAATPGTTVRLTGAVQRLADQLTAPLSGRSCVYYLAIVQEYRRRGKSGNWVELIREEQHVDFLLRDATGLAHVRMDMPHVVAVRDHNTRSGTFNGATDREAAFLARFAEESTGLLGLNRPLRYIEGALEFDEQITVRGEAQPGQDPVRLRIECPPDGQLLLTDHPRTVRAQPKPPAWSA